MDEETEREGNGGEEMIYLDRLKSAFHLLKTGHSLEDENCRCDWEKPKYGTAFIHADRVDYLTDIDPKDTPFYNE